MKNEIKKYLLDALNACRAIQVFTENKTIAAYQSDLLLRSAVERQFEIIGEALNRADKADPEVVQLLPDLRRIVDLRNRVIHGYDSVDDELLWQSTVLHVPALAQKLADILQGGV